MAHDSVDKRARVLVVEDVPTTRNMYARNLRLQDRYRVDAVADLAQATDALDRCAYHVALVDIMLAGEKDVANRDGLAVLERIRALEEGTQAIVLSAQQEKQLVRDFLKQYDAYDYLDKKVLNDSGIAAMIDLVASAVENSAFGATPSWDVVVLSLSGRREEPIFVSELMRRLTFHGGFENLSRTLAAATRYLVPLVPPVCQNAGLEFDADRGGFVAHFWSKGQACPIEFAVFGKRDASSADGTNATDSVLLSQEKAGLEVVVSQLPNRARDDFTYAGS